MSMSVFLCIAVIALLLAAGLAVDGAAQAAARRTCQTAAAQVARIGVDAAASTRLDLSPGQAGAVAVSAARRAAADLHPGLTMTAEVGRDGRLHVQATTRIGTLFLGLAGIHELSASGKATAELRPRDAP